MSKSKKDRKKVKADKLGAKSKNQPAVAQTFTGSSSFWHNGRLHKILLFLCAVLLYANTLTHNYTQDDAIVIYDNMFTQKGLSGIPGILSNDTFYGFFKEEGKAKLVTGGRYRPLTQIMFALEWQLFGKNPTVGHLMNLLLYGLLGIMIYKTLMLLMLGENKAGNKEGTIRMLVFFTTLLYIAHPIHTEAVANIKGRDEIMTTLLALVALWSSMKYYHSKNSKWTLITILSFFGALMSKENAITFLAVVPLGYMLFKRQSIINNLKNLWPFVLSTVAFLVIRTMVLGGDFGSKSMELMNNPFIKLSGNNWIPFSGGEKFATILFTLGKYLGLMVFPHPLSHDYYPRAIDIMQFGDWQVLLSLVMYVGLVALALMSWKKDKVISFGIFYFIITLSIVSNIVFPIGTNMSERFMFMPSLGILLVLVRLATKYIKSQPALYGLMAIAFCLMSFKTVTRNAVWKDDYTLFTTDVKTNPRSAKLLNAAGGTLTNAGSKLPAGKEKTEKLRSAIGYLEQAIEIHPTYRNAYLLLGNAHYYLDEYDTSVRYLEHTLKLSPDFKDAKKNLPIILRDAGKYYGEKKQDLVKSETYLKKALALNPNDMETLRLLGIVNGIKGDLNSALTYFEKALALDPKMASNYVNIGTTYQNMDEKEKAREYYDKATAIDPKALNQLVNKQ